MTTTLDGLGASITSKVALAGADLVAELADTGGTLGGAVPVLLGQIWVDGSSPTGVPAWNYWLDPAQTVVFHDGNATPGPPIGPVPMTFGPVSVPPGLAGFVLRLQGFGLTPAAVNGQFAASRAVDHHFVD